MQQAPAARLRGDAAAAGAAPPSRAPRGRGSASGASLRWLVTALVAWLAISLVLFLISAQIQSAKVSERRRHRAGRRAATR